MKAKSPCIKECRLNENDICKGCKRTIEQITNWWDYTDKQRENIMNNLELKVRLENLESTIDNIVEALENTIQDAEQVLENEELTDGAEKIFEGRLESAQGLLENIRKWEKGDE
jgi:predicted Fe-S protein YdhL (DUF1289 family)